MARTKKSVVQDLMQQGWNKPLANQAYSRWGVSATEVLYQDPFAILYLDTQVKWREVDAIAQRIGFQEYSPERLVGGIRYTLLSSTNEGHVFLPYGELQRRVARLLQLEEENSWNDAIQSMLHHREILTRPGFDEAQQPMYLLDLHQAETRVAYSMVQLHVSPSPMAMQAPTDSELREVEEKLHVDLAPAQRQAITQSLTHKVMIITGGPGTGKTTIIRGILHLWKQREARIRLAAPTGRAAKRLAESTGRKALTLHRLLEFSPDTLKFMRNERRKLRADLLVVDEASMIDIELMAHLLEALPVSCHLLLVGDVDQLPAVGPGFVLHDLIESNKFCTIHLTDIYRQQEGSLISLNASKINQGEMPDLQGAGVEQGQDFFFINRTSQESTRSALLEMVTERIPQQFGLDPKEQIQVLCPMIKRDVGVEAMNLILQEKLNPSDTQFKAPFYYLSPGDKIMQTKNDYSKDIFNGDIGYVTEIDAKKKIVQINFEGREIEFEQKELDKTSLAYAMTVHKSQGSEYPAVVVPLVMQHFPMLQRNLLYTAVSRGKQVVVLIGETRALQIAVQNNKIRARYTGLNSLLEEEFVKVQARSSQKRKTRQSDRV